MQKIYLVVVCLLITLFSYSQESDYLKVFDQEIPQKANKEFQFLAFFYNHYVNSNMFPTNDFLKGQVVGRLYGPNTTNTVDTANTQYFEQRIIPFFIFQPKIFNGKAILRASLEIDWTWGDAAYGTGGNFGSAISADQTNIQTQNIELEFIPAPRWAINLGLQRLYDTPHNPYRTFFDRMTNTGYRLMYWGTDGVGISVRRDGDFNKIKFGYYQLYENNIQENDDVSLTEFTYQQSLSPKWNLGGSLYYVRDRANGEGGPSILGQGLNSTLVDYNGAFRFPFGGDPYKADVFWAGTYFSRNESFMMDKFLLTGFVNANIGYASKEVNGNEEKGASIFGIGANLKGCYRYGQTINDAIMVDAIYTSGDEDGIQDKHYSGVMTGNTWGAPAGIFISHGGYILFPHGNVVNRFFGAVADISNQGYGVLGGTVNLSKSFIPHKLYAKVGTAVAMSNATPRDGGKFVGIEGNFRVTYQIGPFMHVDLHAAHLWLGDFFDSPRVIGSNKERPADPWTTFVSFRWLMF